MFNKDISDRLITIREKFGYTNQKVFAEIIGIKWRTLQTYEQGTVKKMPFSYFELLNQHFNVSKDWILTGEGEMLESSEDISSNSVIDTDKFISVPIVSAKASGSPVGEIHYAVVTKGEVSIAKMLFKTMPNVDNIQAVEVMGNSMSPRINPGDYVVIDKKDSFDHDGIYVLQFDSMLLVKRLQVTTKGIKIISDNQSYDDDFYNPDDDQRMMHIVGKVILVINRDMASF